jgi:hypothetical protein
VIFSSILSAIGIIGYYMLAVRKSRQGLTVGIIYNVLWIVYAIFTHQWPFIVICAFFVGVNVLGYYKWKDK